MITVIGRGHSGTRTISHTLYASGVYMGQTLNPSGDLVPAHAMYDACRIFARYVKWNGDLSWDFSRAHDAEIPPVFTRTLKRYLESVLKHSRPLKGWKVPETTLVFPWILRLFPDMHYIFWIRNPRDCIIGSHKTDDMRDFGIQYPALPEGNAAAKDAKDAKEAEANERLRRAISWKYQYDLVKSTPKPKRWIEVRFEDLVSKQGETLARLEAFLGIPLARVVMRQDTINRWQRDEGLNYFDFFEKAMREYDYQIPPLDDSCRGELPSRPQNGE